MKNWVLIGLLLVSVSAYAQNIPAHYNAFGALVPGAVPSSVNNSQSVENEAMTASQPSGVLPNVVISGNNQLYINGDKVGLSPTQQQMIDTYGNVVRTYKPKVQSMINQGVDSTKSLFGSVSTSVSQFMHQSHLDNTLSNCKTQVSKYIKDGELVFPVDMFDNKKTLNTQIKQTVTSMSAQSTAMFEQMNQQMKKNQQTLQRMRTQLAALQAKINTKNKNESSQSLSDKANLMQQDLDQLSAQELALRNALPKIKSSNNHNDIVIESAANSNV
jgi:hypothetical protein